MSDPRQLILGTAGHIDHGKTALVRALTGIDCDRLPEEKQRGITIDIGFAHLDLGEAQLGIVDVPGHERFIANMLAGASGIDMVMLVVAADDSVMPQTREHLEILKLLDVQHGLVALTKTDLVDQAWVEMVEHDVRELLKGTFLENAPIIRTSTVTGEGIERLKQALRELATVGQRSDIDDLFRLAIDRSFVIQGRGTVVTGTVWSGRLRVNNEIEWLPAQQAVRVRGLQSHGHDVREVIRGQRAAINLLGVHHSDIRRGHELATPGYLRPSKLLTAAISLLPDSPWPIRHRAQVRLHLGTQERIATVSLLKCNSIQPGESADAQLACDEPMLAVAGQPFVLRAVSPLHTIGGGHVLQPAAKRIRRKDDAAIACLQELKSPDDAARAAAAVFFFNVNPWTDLDLMRDAQLRPATAGELIEELVETERVIQLGATRAHRDTVAIHEEAILRMMKLLHARNPIEKAIPRSRLVHALTRRCAPEALNALIDRMLANEQLIGDDHAVALPQSRPKLTESQNRLLRTVLETYRTAGLTPPDTRSIARQAAVRDAELRPIIDLCLAEGQLIHIGNGMFLHRDAEAVLRQRVIQLFNSHDRLTVSQIREGLATSRKYALPFCEYLDRIGITRRVGDERILSASRGMAVPAMRPPL